MPLGTNFSPKRDKLYSQADFGPLIFEDKSFRPGGTLARATVGVPPGKVPPVWGKLVPETVESLSHGPLWGPVLLKRRISDLWKGPDEEGDYQTDVLGPNRLVGIAECGAVAFPEPVVQSVSRQNTRVCGAVRRELKVGDERTWAPSTKERARTLDHATLDAGLTLSPGSKARCCQ